MSPRHVSTTHTATVCLPLALMVASPLVIGPICQTLPRDGAPGALRAAIRPSSDRAGGSDPQYYPGEKMTRTGRLAIAVMVLLIPPGLCLAQIDEASLANATYRLHSVPGVVQLDNGSFRTSAAPGSASEIFVGLTPHVVYGELDGQSVAAVVLVTTAGGSGTFFELAVMAVGTTAPRNIATVVLGDRVRLLSLGLRNNEITVDLVRAGPDDSLCCPTRRLLERYELRGFRLSRTAQEPVPRD